MPDKHAHRGPDPRDGDLFGPSYWPALREAVADLSWLLGRGYAPVSALKLVGDRWSLTERQRQAVRRAAFSDDARQRRTERFAVSVGPISDPAALSIVLEGSARGSCCQHVDETVYLSVLFPGTLFDRIMGHAFSRLLADHHHNLSVFIVSSSYIHRIFTCAIWGVLAKLSLNDGQEAIPTTGSSFSTA